MEDMKTLWPAKAKTADPSFVQKVIADLQPRVKTLTELVQSSDFYFADEIQYDKEAAQKFLTSDIVAYLKAIADTIPSVQQFGKESLEEFFKTFTRTQNIKFKLIAQPLRVALTGKTVSPGIDEVMITLGKERVIKNIHQAIAYIESPASRS